MPRSKTDQHLQCHRHDGSFGAMPQAARAPGTVPPVQTHNNLCKVSYGTAQVGAARPWHMQISLWGCWVFVFCLVFIIPPHMDVNCFGPGGITCHLLSKPRSCRVELEWHGLFLGLGSEPVWQLPPTRLGTADEKCPLSEVKIKRKRCCSCRLHFSLLLAMWQTHRVLYLYLEHSNFSW